MNLAGIVSQSIQSLASNRLRSFLTMLGVVWGTASVVFLLGWGRGFVKVMEVEARSAGDGFIVMWPKRASSEVSGRKGERELKFEIENVDAILDHCPSVRYATAEDATYTFVKYGNRLKSGRVHGVSVDEQYISNLPIDRGRFVQPDDIKNARRVAVLGAAVKDTLFPEGYDPIGSKVKIQGVSFEVIGILVRKGDQLIDMGGPDDDKTYVPVTSFTRYLSGLRTVDEIKVQPWNPYQSKACLEEVRTALAHELDFSPEDEEAIETFDISNLILSLDVMSLIIAVFITTIGVITLFVGGVGVMNIMLISVTERTREIGIRKAIGATRRHIVMQFLGEALTITMLSGFIGVALGVAICVGFAALPRPKILAAPEVSFVTVAASFLVMVLVGLFAGTAPARRAARMQPVEALRH
jgi:ABC-type antimicrobial peptide transport system permease subunit